MLAAVRDSALHRYSEIARKKIAREIHREIEPAALRYL